MKPTPEKQKAPLVKVWFEMRWSQMLVPTSREGHAKEAPPPLALMARAGYAKVVGRRVSSYLPVGQRCVRKMEELTRRRLAEKGGQEFSLRGGRALRTPSSEYPSASKSGEGSGGAAGRSRAAHVFEAERILREIASSHLRSYKELPQIWFYFGFDTFGSSQEYVSRSLFLSVGGAGDANARDPARTVLSEVIHECEANSVVAEGAPQPGRETKAEEHIVLSPHGELRIAFCGCGYSADLECATSRAVQAASDESCPDQPRLVETPGKRTIAAVSEFLGVPPASVIKSLLYVIGGKPVLALLQGDDQLNEYLLCRAAGSSDARPANAEEVKAIFGAEPGSIGPVGRLKTRILADRALLSRHKLVCGANKDDHHLTGVEPEKHFRAEYFDLRQVRPGDACANCGQPLRIEKAHCLIRSSVLRQPAPGTAPVRVLGADNKLHQLSANVHTLYLDTLLLCVIGHLSDDDGIVLPRGIAPFDVVIAPVNYADKEQREVCERIYKALTREGAEVLLDDRDCSPGVKFKDADLIGVPLRVTVGPKKVREGKVELRSRRTHECLDCGIQEVVRPAVRRLIR